MQKSEITEFLIGKIAELLMVETDEIGADASLTDEVGVDSLDMQDLYYRYQWAINDSKINPGSSKGELDPSVVIERRRALEWVLSDENDWYDIQLNA